MSVLSMGQVNSHDSSRWRKGQSVFRRSARQQSRRVRQQKERELRFDAHLDTLYSPRDGAVRAQSQLLLNLKSGRLEALA